MFTLNKETIIPLPSHMVHGLKHERDIYTSAKVVGLSNKNTTDGTLGLFDSDNTHYHYQHGSNITFVFGSKETTNQ